MIGAARQRSVGLQQVPRVSSGLRGQMIRAARPRSVALQQLCVVIAAKNNRERKNRGGPMVVYGNKNPCYCAACLQRQTWRVVCHPESCQQQIHALPTVTACQGIMATQSHPLPAPSECLPTWAMCADSLPALSVCLPTKATIAAELRQLEGYGQPQRHLHPLVQQRMHLSAMQRRISSGWRTGSNRRARNARKCGAA